MKKLVVILLASLVATSAFAIGDTDPNSIGIYFDTNADVNCFVPNVYEEFNAYLIVVNTTAPVVGFYEAGFRNELLEGDDTKWLQTGSVPIATALDIGTSDKWGGDIIAGIGTPVAAEPALVLHTWTYVITTFVPMRVNMYLSNVSEAASAPGPYPSILNQDTATFIQCPLSTGGVDTPVAMVNPVGDCVVSVEETSFGSVKSLYR